MLGINKYTNASHNIQLFKALVKQFLIKELKPDQLIKISLFHTLKKTKELIKLP